MTKRAKQDIISEPKIPINEEFAEIEDFDELKHKKKLFFKYKNIIDETTLIRRLGLKAWEIEYIKNS